VFVLVDAHFPGLSICLNSLLIVPIRTCDGWTCERAGHDQVDGVADALVEGGLGPEDVEVGQHVAAAVGIDSRPRHLDRGQVVGLDQVLDQPELVEDVGEDAPQVGDGGEGPGAGDGEGSVDGEDSGEDGEIDGFLLGWEVGLA